MKKIPLNCMIKEKATIPNITSPAMMDVYEVINKFPDETSPVVIEDSVNGEHEDGIRKYLVDKNYTKKNEVRELSI